MAKLKLRLQVRVSSASSGAHDQISQEAHDNTQEAVNKAADTGREAADEAARTARRVTDEVARIGEHTARAGADLANRSTVFSGCRVAARWKMTTGWCLGLSKRV